MITSYVGLLTIANAGTQSNVLGSPTMRLAEFMEFETPAAFTGTITVYGSFDNDTTIGAMKPLYNNGTVITIGANRIERYSIGGLSSIAIQSGSAEGAQRDVKVYAVLHTQ